MRCLIATIFTLIILSPPVAIAQKENIQALLDSVAPNVVKYVQELHSTNNIVFQDLLKGKGLKIVSVDEKKIVNNSELQERYDFLLSQYNNLKSETDKELSSNSNLLPADQCFALFRNDWSGCVQEPINEINNLSKTLELVSWNEIVEALRNNFRNLEPSTEYFIKSLSVRECRKYYPLTIDNSKLYQCQFRVGATYVKFNHDQKTCTDDTKALYSDFNDDVQKRIQHICIRNLGWRSSEKWQGNITF